MFLTNNLVMTYLMILLYRFKIKDRVNFLRLTCLFFFDLLAIFDKKIKGISV